MNEEKYLELIHKDLDGLLEPSEQETLDSYLAESEEGRTLHRELNEVSKLLSKAESPEPPPYLKKHILNSIPSSRYSQPPPLSPISRLARPGLKITYAFAAGLLAGIVLFSIFHNMPRPDPSDLTGTVSNFPNVDDFKVVDRAEIAEGWVSGTLEMQVNTNLVLVTMRLAANTEMSVEIKFNTEALELRSFENQDNSVTGIGFQDGITLEGSRVAGSLFFNRQEESASTIEVRISDDPNVIDRTLSVVSR